MSKAFLTSLLLVAGLQNGLTQSISLTLNTVKSGFSSVTSLAHCEDERLFVVEQAGLIKFFFPGNPSLDAATFLDIRSKVKFSGEEGLLGLAFDPFYTQNGRLYVFYTNLSGNQVVSRFTTNLAFPDQVDAGTETILLTIPHPTYTNHNGGCLQVNKRDGHLYIASGDGGGSGDPLNTAQNGQSLSGKILRIDTDGNIPENNPFVSNPQFRDEIWAYGLRNPWRFSFDRFSNDFWIADVGQGNREEVNFQPDSSKGGENYGWKCFEGTATYSGCSLAVKTDPIFEYNHNLGCSITGGYVYRGNLFSDIYSRYFAADFCSGRIWSVIQDGPGVFKDTLHGSYTSNAYTTFGEDQYGEMYIAEKSGRIRRLESSAPPRAVIEGLLNRPACEGNQVLLRTGFHPELSYAWFRNDTLIEGANSNSVTVITSGNYSVRVSRVGSDPAISDDYTLKLNSLPIAFASSSLDSLCEDAAFPIQLNGQPAGGTFFGTRVNQNQFDPYQLGAGTYQIVYRYTSEEGCNAIPDTFNITLLPLPVVQLNGLKENYCLNEAPDTLSAEPEGGLIGGPGIQNGIFFPDLAGIGEHVITYSFTDTEGCTTVETLPVSVDICASIAQQDYSSLIIYPNPHQGNMPLVLEGLPLKGSKIELFDAEGRLNYTGDMNHGSNKFELNINFLNPGIYLVKISHQHGADRFGKLVKF
jgi:glucose/arabinose dehydrogenase